LINFPFVQNKLLTNQKAILVIALNVLVNQYESSIVRSQACSFLTNLTHSLVYPNSETNKKHEMDENFVSNIENK